MLHMLATRRKWPTPIVLHVLACTCVPEAAHGMNLHMWHTHQLLSAYVLTCTMLEHVYGKDGGSSTQHTQRA
jgi:hypothetical protein